MPKKKTQTRNPWSKEDIRELKAHSKARTPVAKVAKAMKRTEGAVRQKATDYRHRSRSPTLTTATQLSGSTEQGFRVRSWDRHRDCRTR